MNTFTHDDLDLNTNHIIPWDYVAGLCILVKGKPITTLLTCTLYTLEPAPLTII